MIIMKNPSCPKCGSCNFGIKEFSVQNANFRHYAIMCTDCGCVVGTETMQDDERINQLAKRIDSLQRSLANIEGLLRRRGY